MKVITGLAFVWASVLFGHLAQALSPGEGVVNLAGGRIWYRIVGEGKGTPLLVVHGGPGSSSDYLDRLRALSDERPVVFYDQLGSGRSERPYDPGLFRIERYVEELAELRQKLGLARVHILAHSWGTQLTVDYLLGHRQGVESVVLSSPALSIPRWLQDANALRKTLPAATQETMARHERAGTTDSDEYRAAVRVYDARHVCRLSPLPRELYESVLRSNAVVYNTMWGANEFTPTGHLKDYDRTARLRELRLPVLFTAGRYDEATPAATRWYNELTPGSTIALFENSAHYAMLEETDRYVETVRQFLRAAEAGRVE